MKIDVKNHPEDYLVVLSGRDASPEALEELKTVLEAGFADSRGPRIVLDIAELTYLGSEGVGVLAAAHKRLSDQGRVFILRNPTPAVDRVLHVTRLAQFLIIEKDES